MAVLVCEWLGFAPVPGVYLAAYVRNLCIEEDLTVTNRKDRMESVLEETPNVSF